MDEAADAGRALRKRDLEVPALPLAADPDGLGRGLVGVLCVEELHHGRIVEDRAEAHFALPSC
jgi:hypothetical protein